MPAEISFASKGIEDLSIPHQVGVDPSTGSATISVDIPLTAGRADFHPTLSLVYNSSSRNSIFGMGWALSGIPSIDLSFKDGLPKYDGSDKFTFGGAELVPWLEEDNQKPRILDDRDYWIHLYRSKSEQGFLRFEKWVHKTSQRIHWRLRDRQNTLSIFGLNKEGMSRVYEPENEHHTAQWLLEAQYDKFGNAIYYEYESENADNVDSKSTFESNRISHSKGFAQRYLKRIHYGNTKPLTPDNLQDSDNQWLFEVVMDYGEHNGDIYPSHQPLSSWSTRQDPFSSYQAGFEVRTYRLCHKILMFHHFSELGNGATLIGELELGYQENTVATTLEKIHYHGYRRDQQTAYSRKSLPPLEFQYSEPEVGKMFLSPPEETHENAPYGIGGLNYRWIDLYGEGLPGILYENQQAWYYKSNLGGGKLDSQQKVLEKPSMRMGDYTLSDFDGDGNLNLVVLQGRQAGFYEYDRDGKQWQSFQPFLAAPHVESLGAHTQLLDLNGDGRADIVTLDQDRITWYPSKGKEGFSAPVELAKPRTNGVSRAPTIGANLNLDYFFADMTGDGLPDQVRIINGRVEYWPQLGNGKFGAGVVMENAPSLDFDSEFDASRIRLIDLDGSGTSDILYIGRGEIRYWINASGNRFLKGTTVTGLPYIDNVSSATVLDFLGDGTPCLVWSTTLPGHNQDPLQYLRLTNGIKPRLLEGVENSMGKEVHITYANSASHYLRDKNNGREWLSKIPQHVTVVDRLEVKDNIGNTRFQSLYEYHDGFYDSEERAFKGFGLVDQYDSDTYRGSASDTETVHSDPVCVRTWFHTGTAEWHSLRTRDYYQGDAKATVLPAHLVENPGTLAPGELTDAFLPLAGRAVRTETYGMIEKGIRKVHPFEVNQTQYSIRRLQGKNKQDDACFFAFAKQSLTILYEQNPNDPRVTHEIALVVDDYGNVKQNCSIAYPRRSTVATELTAQQQTIINVAQAEFIDIDVKHRYELGIPIENKAFEIAGLAASQDKIFSVDELRDDLNLVVSDPLPFDQEFPSDLQDSGPKSRLMQWNRNYYWNNTQTDSDLFREVGDKALVHHTESACFTDDLITEVYGPRTAPSMPDTAGYLFKDDYWWQAGPTLHYLESKQFFLLSHQERLDGGMTSYTYDPPYLLTLTGIADALQNKIEAGIDYHLIAPYRITDPNENVSEVLYDPLGVTVVSTVQGDILSSSGAVQRYGNELLESYQPQTLETFEQILAEPSRYLQGESQYIYYELKDWTPGGPPLRSLSLAREEFVHDGEGSGISEGRIQIAIDYIDGFGRILQSKTRVDSGDAITLDDNGNVVVVDGKPVLSPTEIRWRTSGHTVFNNKQQVIQQYEPFFSPTHAFQSDPVLKTFGVTTLTHYDAVGREIRTDFSNGTLTRTEVTPWEIRQYDPNDAIEGSRYEEKREAITNSDDPEKKALRQALKHHDTPIITHFDPLGREFSVVDSDPIAGKRRTKTVLDYFGNPISIFDPRKIIDPRDLNSQEVPAFTYQYDMLGRTLHEHSIDAGDRWTFPNALDQVIHQWDDRGINQQLTYDRLGRVETIHVISGAPELDQIIERMEYGEDNSVPDAKLRNARGQLVQHHDQAGLLTVQRYDPSGNIIQSDRKLLVDYQKEPDWSKTERVALEIQGYRTEIRYDALGRVKQQQLPDGTTRQMTYRWDGGINQVRVNSEDGKIDTAFLQQADYNARGQRTQALLGNDVELTYEYDSQTLRMNQLVSRFPANQNTQERVFQDIHYTYDPVGNLIYSIDHAQAEKAKLIRNLPAGSLDHEYEYDAFYQLTQASGRVHQALMQNDNAFKPSALVKSMSHITPNNSAAIEQYTRSYEYDLGGNIRNIVQPGNLHTSFWTSIGSNRSLPQKDLNGIDIANPESYFDANGNCLYLPHLRGFEWNYRNNLARAIIIDRSADGGPDDAEFYVYGSDGQRIRKVTQQMLGNGDVEITEKIYLDGCEIKRVRIDTEEPFLERITSHISDGNQNIALLHQWTTDTSALETDVVSNKKIHYQLTDHLGSSSMELDQDRRVITYEEYFPFGGTAFIAGKSEKEIRLKDYRYTGKERDDATGLYYFGYRYYAPWIGNWLSPDPIGPEDGLNLYQFVGNNPVNLVDADGLLAKKSIGGNDYEYRLNRDEIRHINFSPEERGALLEGSAVVEVNMSNFGTTTIVARNQLNSFIEQSRIGQINLFVYDPALDALDTELNFDDELVIGRPIQSSLEEFVAPVSDDDFNDIIEQLVSAQTDAPNSQMSIDPSDMLSVDPHEQALMSLPKEENRPSSGAGGNTQAQSTAQRNQPPASSVSEFRNMIIELGGESEVGQFGMGIVAGAYTLVAEPVGWVIDMGIFTGNAVYDPYNFDWHSQRYASDLARYIVTETGEGNREASDVSTQLVTDMAIDFPTLGVRHIPGQVETILSDETSSGEKGVATFNLGMTLYGARQGARSYAGLAQRGLTRAGITTGTQRLNAAVTGRPLKTPLFQSRATRDLIGADETIPWNKILPENSLEAVGIGPNESSVLTSLGGGINARSGLTSFDPNKLNRIIQNLEQEGIITLRGKTAAAVLEDVRIINLSEKAPSAAYIPGRGRPGVLVLRENAALIEVIEELIHLGQHRRVGWRPVTALEHARFEVDAARRVIDFLDRSGLTGKDLEKMHGNLGHWLRRVEAYEAAEYVNRK